MHFFLANYVLFYIKAAHTAEKEVFLYPKVARDVGTVNDR